MGTKLRGPLGLVALAVIILVSAGLGWHFFSPYFAVSGLKNAAVAGDTVELERRVDFPRVREHLKAVWLGYMADTLGTTLKDNPFAGLGMMLAAKFAEGAIETMVTPSGLAGLASFQDKPPSSPTSALELWQSGQLVIEHRGLDEFEISHVDPSANGLKLSFRRDGLGWRLVKINMPKGAFPTAKSTQQVEAPPVKPAWRFYDSKNPMDDSVRLTLSREVDVSIPSRFRPLRPKIFLRCHTTKLDAFMVTDTTVGSDSGSTSLHTVRLRFDDDAPLREIWTVADSRDALFAPSPQQLIKALLGAKRWLFEFTPVGESAAIAQFTIDDLEAQLPKLAAGCPQISAASSARAK